MIQSVEFLPVFSGVPATMQFNSLYSRECQQEMFLNTVFAIERFLFSIGCSSSETLKSADG
jgi:hypothetical protein